jgi:hypothetical protein
MSSVRYPRIDMENLIEFDKFECDLSLNCSRNWNAKDQNHQDWLEAHSIEKYNEELCGRKRFRPEDSDCTSSYNEMGWPSLELTGGKGHTVVRTTLETLAEGSNLAVYLTRKGQRVDPSSR